MKKTKTKTDAKSLWIKIGVIAFVAIFVATLLFSVLRYSTGVMHRLTPAITVGDEKATAMDMRVFYADTRMNYLYQYGYILQMYGYDLSTIDAQTCLYDSTITWSQYFLNQALNSMTSVLILKQMAEADGYKVSAEVKADVAAYIDGIEQAAKDADMSTRTYLKRAYGTGTSLKDIERIATLSQYTNEYYETTFKGFYDGVTAEQVESYYGEHKKEFDVANYYELVVPYEEVKYTAPKDGETLPEGAATSDEDATLKTEENRKAAEALANEIKEKVTAENFDEIAKEYWTKIDADNKVEDFTTRLTSGKISDETSEIGKWYNSTEIAAGAKIVLDNTTNHEYIVALYVDRTREEIEAVNVHHILIGATTEIGEDVKDEEKAELEKAKAEAKAKADEILDEFKAGANSVEAFEALSKKYAKDADEISNPENVVPGQMVENFDAWIFDEARKPGDVEVVETQYGYHVIYFDGEGELSYIASIKNTLAGEKYTEKFDSFSKDMESKTSKFGMMLAF